MLRIRRDEVDDHEVILVLEGRVAAEWAELLERNCDELLRSGLRVQLDLAGAIFISRSGFEVLSRLRGAGVGIIGLSPLLAAMLEQEGIPAKCESRDPDYR